MGRRHVKEFRPDEALSLIIADRETRPLRCPSCGSDAIQRSPGRQLTEDHTVCRVILACQACKRIVSYIDRGEPSFAVH
jgi:DNA-directed RNA polymerase subunit RPC12/RpoP